MGYSQRFSKNTFEYLVSYEPSSTKTNVLHISPVMVIRVVSLSATGDRKVTNSTC